MKVRKTGFCCCVVVVGRGVAEKEQMSQEKQKAFYCLCPFGFSPALGKIFQIVWQNWNELGQQMTPLLE